MVDNSFFKILLVIFLILAGGLVFILYRYGNPLTPATESVDIAFETIAKGQIGAEKENKNYIVEDKDEWQKIWDKVYANTVPKPLLPEIDFGASAVIAVFQGEKPSGGYDIEIIKMTENNLNTFVFVKEISPDENCGVITVITSPYHIIGFKKADKKIVFKVSKEVIKCE